MIDLVKDAFKKEKLLANLSFFVLLNVGLILTALGIVWFKTPNHFAFGGTSGLSVLLAALFPQFFVFFFMWVLNLVLVVLGFVFLRPYNGISYNIFAFPARRTGAVFPFYSPSVIFLPSIRAECLTSGAKYRIVLLGIRNSRFGLSVHCNPKHRQMRKRNYDRPGQKRL